MVALHPHLVAILKVLERLEDVSMDTLESLVNPPLSRRTLQRRLAEMVDLQLVLRHGDGRAVRYALVKADRSVEDAAHPVLAADTEIDLSPAGAEIRDLIRRPARERRPVEYHPDFLRHYVPNDTWYLTEKEREMLAGMGQAREADGKPMAPAAAGTFVKKIHDRLLIDLSFASSHLEGNTYSLLDTQHLIERGEAAQGKNDLEATMILNHKAAVEFLVNDPDCARVSSRGLKNLHALLSDGLIPDMQDAGRLRRGNVGIAGSVYFPLRAGPRVEEMFELIATKADAIDDPFEQAFFLMVHLPYLQPFMDVNKRVSRLAANIPLIQANLCPLSFIGVSTEAYVEATLGVYELNRIELLRDLFFHAYGKSCQRYVLVYPTLQTPDPFRMRYRRQMSHAVASIVRADERLTKEAVERHMPEAVPDEVRSRFIDLVLAEFKGLHPDNAIRFGLRPLEVEAWQRAHGGG